MQSALASLCALHAYSGRIDQKPQTLDCLLRGLGSLTVAACSQARVLFENRREEVIESFESGVVEFHRWRATGKHQKANGVRTVGLLL